MREPDADRYVTPGGGSFPRPPRFVGAADLEPEVADDERYEDEWYDYGDPGPGADGYDLGRWDESRWAGATNRYAERARPRPRRGYRESVEPARRPPSEPARTAAPWEPSEPARPAALRERFESARPRPVGGSVASERRATPPDPEILDLYRPPRRNAAPGTVYGIAAVPRNDSADRAAPPDLPAVHPDTAERPGASGPGTGTAGSPSTGVPGGPGAERAVTGASGIVPDPRVAAPVPPRVVASTDGVRPRVVGVEPPAAVARISTPAPVTVPRPATAGPAPAPRVLSSHTPVAAARIAATTETALPTPRVTPSVPLPRLTPTGNGAAAPAPHREDRARPTPEVRPTGTDRVDHGTADADDRAPDVATEAGRRVRHVAAEADIEVQEVAAEAGRGLRDVAAEAGRSPHDVAADADRGVREVAVARAKAPVGPPPSGSAGIVALAAPAAGAASNRADEDATGNEPGEASRAFAPATETTPGNGAQDPAYTDRKRAERGSPEADGRVAEARMAWALGVGIPAPRTPRGVSVPEPTTPQSSAPEALTRQSSAPEAVTPPTSAPEAVTPGSIPSEPSPPVPAMPEPVLDAERIVADVRWRLDRGSLREVVDDQVTLLDVARRLEEPLEAAADEPSRARVLCLRAQVRRLLGELDQALADCRTALILGRAGNDDLAVALARTELAHVLRLRGEHAEADRLFLEVVEADVPDPVRSLAYENAGRACVDQGRYLEACDHFGRAVRLGDPAHVDLLARLEMALDAVYLLVLRQGWGPPTRRRTDIMSAGRSPVVVP